MSGIPEKFNALVGRDGAIAVEQVDESILYAEGDVTINVEYSCVNYKDALAITGKGKILRASPLVPGVDYAGEVVSSDSSSFKAGDKVVLTGFGVGESYSGGFADYAKAKSKWLLPLPAGMSTRQAMICGTAGLTAAFCVQALLDSGTMKSGDSVVVSGASGGVGSFAVLLLSRMGYQVTAVSREAAGDYLKALGAAEIIPREDMSADARPLEKSRWAGAIDCVGGAVLTRMLAEMNYGAVVAACGLAADFKLNTTVMPFILRGVTLAGIDSVMASTEKRASGWELLKTHLSDEDYDRIGTHTITLPDLPDACEAIIKGDSNGRILVRPSEELG